MDEDILKALAEAGNEGLSLQKIVLYAYNCQNNLFQKCDIEEVRAHVAWYLRQNSRYTGSFIQKVSRGVYRLNADNVQGRQLLLSFNEYNAKSKSHPCLSGKKSTRTLFDDIL